MELRYTVAMRKASIHVNHVDNTGDFDFGLWEALGFQFQIHYRTGDAQHTCYADCKSGRYNFRLSFYRLKLRMGPPESAMAQVTGEGERGQRDEHHMVCQTEALNWFCDLSEEFRARAVPIVEAWQKHGPEFWRRNREAGVMVWG